MSEYTSYTGGMQASMPIGKNLSTLVEYTYYSYDVTGSAQLPSSLPPAYQRTPSAQACRCACPSSRPAERAPETIAMLPGRKYTPDQMLGLLVEGRWIIAALVFVGAFGGLLVSRTLATSMRRRQPCRFCRSACQMPMCARRLRRLSTSG